MNLDETFAAVWQALNSPIGISFVSGIVLWLLAKLFTAKPAWAAWEGTIITAVKVAEKYIPDDANSPGLARLDVALKYVLRIVEQVQGRPATAAESAAISQGIQIVHAQLESAGSLDKGPTDAAPPQADPPAFVPLVPKIPAAYPSPESAPPSASGRVSLAGLVLIAAVAVVLLCVGGCSSDSMSAWVDRANVQVGMQQATMDGMYSAQITQEGKNQKASIASMVREAKRAFVYKTTTQPTTSPADQEAWLDEQERFLNIMIDESRAREATLRARQELSQKGFDGIREDLQRIRDINAAWYRTNADTSAAIQSLATQIQQMRAEKAVAK